MVKDNCSKIQEVSKFIDFVGAFRHRGAITIMSKARYFKYLFHVVTITIIGTLVVWSQQPDDKNQNDDARSQPIKAKSEPNNVLKIGLRREHPTSLRRQKR